MLKMVESYYLKGYDISTRRRALMAVRPFIPKDIEVLHSDSKACALLDGWFNIALGCFIQSSFS
jgi:hypothetical protein